MKIVDVMWRRPVSTYAISACEGLVASVNSLKTAEREMRSRTLATVALVRRTSTVSSLNSDSDIF